MTKEWINAVYSDLRARRQWSWNFGGKGLDLAAWDNDAGCERGHLYMTDLATDEEIVIRCVRCGYKTTPHAY